MERSEEAPEHVDIDLLRQAVTQGGIHWHQHALERLLERGISRSEVVSALLVGEVIETYWDDRPFPSCLVLSVEGRPLHVVASIDRESGIAHVITVYEPDPNHFEPDFRTRRRKS